MTAEFGNALAGGMGQATDDANTENHEEAGVVGDSRIELTAQGHRLPHESVPSVLVPAVLSQRSDKRRPRRQRERVLLGGVR